MNTRLIIGMVLLLSLLCLALFPSYFTPWPKGYSQAIREITDSEGKESWIFAPEKPSGYFPLGSDNYGYDLLTILLYGLRWTLASVVITALARSFIGTAFGIVKAVILKSPGKDSGLSPLLGIPSFVFVYFLLFPVSFNPTMKSINLLLYQCFIMTIFDTGSIISSSCIRTGQLYSRPFMEAAIASGANRRWQLRYHILPFLYDDFLEVFAEQTVEVLKLIGRLGLFSLFIGGTIYSRNPPLFTSKSGEIAGLVGLYRSSLMHSKWLLTYPMAAYFLVLLSFKFLASGLREKGRKKRRQLS